MNDRQSHLKQLVEQGNQRAVDLGRHDVEWVIKGGELRIQWKRGASA